MTLVLPAVFSRQRFSSNDLWHGCPAQPCYFLIISFRALHLISICRGSGLCGFAGRAGPHWVTYWISFQWQDSTVGFPRLLWLRDFLSNAPKLESETRNLGAAAASEAKVAGSGLSPLWFQPALYGDWGQPGATWHGGSECHRASLLSLPLSSPFLSPGCDQSAVFFSLDSRRCLWIFFSLLLTITPTSIMEWPFSSFLY